MHKVLQCILLKTISALAVLKDIANSAIRRKRVFRDREDLLAHDGNWLIPFEDNTPETVCRAAASATKRGAMSCLCPQVMCTLRYSNRGIPEGTGQPIGTVRRAAAGAGAQHSEEPCAACATGDVHTGV